MLNSIISNKNVLKLEGKSFFGTDAIFGSGLAIGESKSFNVDAEAVLRRCSSEKVFWKYAANLQENTHAEEWFQ